MSYGRNPSTDCLICRGAEGDTELRRILVWEDSLWRLTVSLYSEILGFSYLEPKRHIPYVTDLDGEEARTLGSVLARATRVLQEITGALLVFVLIYGGHIPHLHLHLVPHFPGDAVGTEILTREVPLLPEPELRAVARRIGDALGPR